jgi:hypothetical protein
VYIHNIVSLQYIVLQCKYTKQYLYKTMHYRVDTHWMAFEDKLQDTSLLSKPNRHFSLRISKYQLNSEFDNINIKTHLGIVTNFKKQLSKFPFLWDVTLRQCVIGFRSFEGSYCSHIQGSVGHRIFFLSSILLWPLDFEYKDTIYPRKAGVWLSTNGGSCRSKKGILKFYKLSLTIFVPELGNETSRLYTC